MMCKDSLRYEYLVDLLTTDDIFSRCLTLPACYQSAQSIFTISFALAKRWDRGEVGEFQDGVPCAWQLLWLAVKWVQKPLLFSFRGTLSGSVGSFQLSGAFDGQKALTIKSSLLSRNPKRLRQRSFSSSFRC